MYSRFCHLGSLKPPRASMKLLPEGSSRRTVNGDQRGVAALDEDSGSSPSGTILRMLESSASIFS